MVQAYAPKTAATAASLLRIGSLAEVILFLLLMVLAFFVVYRMNPPSAVSAQAPPTEFSSGRAMGYLNVISSNSHPIGSADHQRVGDYIVSELTSLGLAPEVQQTSIVHEVESDFMRGATLRNIVARVKGTDTGEGRALMLVGHYDSKPISFGASDDGAAVAAMLETARALKAGAPLKNDVIFLFTDGEEIGLLGAKAFVGEHPWARDVGLVLNFEARGSSGPAVMFETSKGNQRLIDGLAAASPRPIANSLMYDIYRVLPNDTDLTVLKQSGLAGMNFAFINQPTHYHTRLDSLKNTDERSLQHHGSYALALARYFGNQSLDVRSNRDAVYFDLFGAKLIHYSALWILPLTALVGLAFVAVVLLGRRKRSLTLGGVTRGFLVFLLSLIISPGVVFLIWWLIKKLHGGYGLMPRGTVYRSEFFFLAFAALSVAIVSALCSFFGRRVGLHNLAVGALLCELILLLASSIYLPGASYLLAWPMLASLIALALSFAVTREETASAKQVVVLALGAVPAVVLFVPMIYLLFVALSLNLAAAVSIVLVLLLGFLIPQLTYLTARRRWLLPAAMGLASLGFIGLGLAYSGFNDSQPKPDNIFYGINADKQEAVWASSDESPDEWTTHFLTATPQESPLEEYFPGTPSPFLKNPAPVAPLAAPEIRVLDDSTQQGVRTLRLQVTSNRGAPLISVYGEPATEIKAVAIKGKPSTFERAPATGNEKGPWVMRYYALPAEGVELVMETKPQAEVKLKVVDQSYELPVLPNVSTPARPEKLMPSTLPWSDVTLVSKSFVF